MGLETAANDSEKADPIRILFLMRDALPPFRPDVGALFGHYLPVEGIFSDLLGQRAPGHSGALEWPAGCASAAGVANKGMLAEFLRPMRDAWGLLRHRFPFDVVQVRDKIRTGVVGCTYARICGKPFVYWISFPFVEGFALTARNRKKPNPLICIADMLRVSWSRRIFYGFILKQADHVFVQSDAMLDWFSEKGFDVGKMTAVPMGVDTDFLRRESIVPSDNPRLEGRRVIVYLGGLGKARRSDFLLDLALAVRECEPDVLLVLAGDAVSPGERTWIREEIELRSLNEHVLLTGWLAQEQALSYVIRAEVGLSPVPRGELYDISSPTKLVEYLALGLPGVANDIPDQRLVIEQSGAGICCPMEVDAFRDAVLRLLTDETLRQRCSELGPTWVRANRSYGLLARRVAGSYRKLLGRCV
ncbi:glycosyltransferase family 4 protein [Accumulibacter sp.]|uniref:glycosyltransferase family 4 protein n=1 Tax=Accumulibacter sp. TaxID=2053492 RepID=UPI0025F95987|nr:glycosyltransferase family 4 protein [Accumulibacter sp.]MCM8611627.1 glycosyltransferase family 4 protein [Accumulibacter sp.]MCM8635392.1 glycosyltransferase family 4 protein [Accumulibacter sp.]MCM8638997.1 glycosyltransferase family 4 protein [Accumulibacter sp.]